MADLDPCSEVQAPSGFQSVYGSRIQHFRVFHDEKTYRDAKAACESQNSRLAVIKSMEAFQFLVDTGELRCFGWLCQISTRKTATKYRNFCL